MSLRDDVLAACATPQSPDSLAAALNVSTDRIAVCLGALDRDGKVTLTTKGWVVLKPIQKRNKARKYEYVNQRVLCACDGQKLHVSAYDGQQRRRIVLDPHDLRDIALYAHDVGLLESLA